MPKYEYQKMFFDRDDTVVIPDDAIGVTTDTFGDRVTVKYLVPVIDE